MRNDNCFNTINSSCVIYTGETYTTTDDGIQICKSDSLDDVLETIIDYALELNDQCTVKTSTTDECCGYLEDKITSSVGTLDITTVVDGDTNCETLNIEIPSPTWEAITFAATFSNQGVEAARSSVDALGRVELRGRITGSTITTTTAITTLGSAFRPANTRFINVNVNNSGNYYPGVIQIQSSGVVDILCNTSGWTGTSGTFSINGYFFIDA